MTTDETERSSWPEARRLAWFRKHGRQNRVDVVLFGPPGCGKTSLVGALMYAAGIRTKSDLERILIPLGGAGEFASKVYQVWLEGSKETLPSAGLQTFQVGFGPAPRETAMEIGILDLDAGEVDALDGHELRQEFQDASVLVLCVDATGVNRDWYWRRLPYLSAQLAIPTDGVVDRLGGERHRSREGRAPLQAPRETRGYSRIVLLLTRADAVIEGWLSSLGEKRLSRLQLGSQNGDLAHQLALRVDAARWIEHLLGKHFISQVRTLLGGTSTEIVAGLTSSRGLQPPTAALPAWNPFGATELLDYLGLGTPHPPFQKVEISGADRWREVRLQWTDSDLGRENS